MELSLLPTGTPMPTPIPVATLTPMDLTPSAPNADSPAPPNTGTITATPLVGVSEAEQDAAFSESCAARDRVDDDTQNIVRALQKSLQTIILQRPDLAQSTFDFVSRKGSLQVVSTELSAKDKSWLTTQLNTNAALLHSVQAFNEDATTLYNFAAGETATEVARSAGTVSDQVDGAIKFLSFLGSLGSDVQSTLNYSGGTYSMPHGSPVDLGKAPNSATRFLSFAVQMQAAAEGDLLLKLHNRFYSHTFKMPNAYADAGYKLTDLLPAAPSLGLSVKA